MYRYIIFIYFLIDKHLFSFLTFCRCSKVTILLYVLSLVCLHTPKRPYLFINGILGAPTKAGWTFRDARCLRTSRYSLWETMRTRLLHYARAQRLSNPKLMFINLHFAPHNQVTTYCVFTDVIFTRFPRSQTERFDFRSEAWRKTSFPVILLLFCLILSFKVYFDFYAIRTVCKISKMFWSHLSIAGVKFIPWIAFKTDLWFKSLVAYIIKLFSEFIRTMSVKTRTKWNTFKTS